MWDSTEQVATSLAQGQLEETHLFDRKRLPGRNKDIAIDVCAMTVDGGTLLYGVDEDENGRITISSPIALAGQRERIDQIVQTSIMEPATIHVSELPTGADPTHGFLVVRLPQSPRAPHQVIVGDDMRYYGRGATGNRLLTEGEVAALYERREQWTVDRGAHLEKVVQTALHPGADSWAYLHAYARPIGFDTGFLRQRLVDDEQALRNALVAATAFNRIPAGVCYEPDLRHQRGWERDGTHGIRIGSGENSRRHVIRMSISWDGEARLFCCCGARVRNDGPISLFDNALAGNLASFFSAAGQFYEQARYTGAVDVGTAVTGIRGSHSHLVVVAQRQMGERVTFEEGIDQEEHRRHERVLASELLERPHVVASSLLRDLFDALVGMGFTPYR